MDRLVNLVRFLIRQLWRVVSKSNKLLDDSQVISKIPSSTLLCRHLTDPVTHISSLAILLLVRLCNHSSAVGFTATLVIALYLFNLQLSSFRSYVNVKRTAQRLSRNRKLRIEFLQALSVNAVAADSKEVQFAWLNQILAFLWPFLSHLIHIKTNDFFKQELEETSVRRRDNFGKVLAAIVKRLDTDIVQIKQFNFGKCAPTIRYITVNTQHSIEDDKLGTKVTRQCRYLAFNINLEYNGDAQFRIVYRYLLCLLAELGLKDAYFKFNMRFVVGPINTEKPFVERLEFCLLDLPEFGYKGIALAELAEVKVVRKIINRAIKKNMLYPKCVIVDLENISMKHDDDDDDYNNNTNVNDDNDFVPDNPFWAKFSARLILCGFCCTNCCLRKVC